MLKSITLALSLCALAGCENSAQQDVFPVLPEALKDCVFYSLHAGGDHIRVVRCPNSSTSATYPVGKSRQTTATVDGN